MPEQARVDMSLLTGETERALMKQIAQFSEIIKLAARDYDPSYINRYLQELAPASTGSTPPATSGARRWRSGTPG